MKQIFPILVSMLLSIMVVGCSENSQDYHSNFLITIENDTIFDVRVDNNRVFFIKTDSTSNSVEPMGYIRDCYNTNSTSNSDGPIGYIKNYYNIENQGSTNIVIPKRVRYGETMFTVINRKDFEESNAMVVVANSMKKRFDNLGNAIIHVPTNTLVAGCANTIIPHTVTKIGNWAFYLCKSLNYIEIPNSVIEIGEEAFEECSGLKTVNIPYSVEKLGSHAFATCRNLENIEIPNSVKEIGAAAFAHCDNLKSITIPNSVEKIGGWCFYNCTNLKSVTILGSTKEIGDWCFNGCYNLESITLPNSVEKIGSSAFSGCENLEQINIPNSVNEIDSWAFNGCSKLKSLYFPETLIKIDSFAFKGCDDLETIFIPNAELYNLLASNQDIFFEQGSLGTKVQLESYAEYDNTEYDDLFEIEPTNDNSSSQYVVINATELRLRYGPSTSAETYKWGDGSNRHPNKGEKYRYLGESGDFYKIDYKGVELWVSKQYTYLE